MDAAPEAEKPQYQFFYEKALKREEEEKERERRDKVQAHEAVLSTVSALTDEEVGEKTVPLLRALAGVRVVEDHTGQLAQLFKQLKKLREDMAKMAQQHRDQLQQFASSQQAQIVSSLTYPASNVACQSSFAPLNTSTSSPSTSFSSLSVVISQSGSAASPDPAAAAAAAASGGAWTSGTVAAPGPDPAMAGPGNSFAYLDRKATQIPSKYDGKDDVESWISTMRSYFDVLGTPPVTQSSVLGTDVEPAVREFLEIQAIQAGYKRIDLNKWLKATPVATLKDLLIQQYADPHAAAKARLKLDKLKHSKWTGTMQSLQQYVSKLFATPNLEMTAQSCLDVIKATVPSAEIRRLGLRLAEYTDWFSLMRDLVKLEAQDLPGGSSGKRALGRKRFSGSNRLVAHDLLEDEEEIFADNPSLDDDQEQGCEASCSASAHESELTQCERTTWKDSQFMVKDAMGIERPVLLDEPRESQVTFLNAMQFCKKWRWRKTDEQMYIAFVRPAHVPSIFAVHNDSTLHAVSTSDATTSTSTKSISSPNGSTSNPVVLAAPVQTDMLAPESDDPPPEIAPDIRNLLNRFPYVLAEPHGVSVHPVRYRIELIEGSTPPKGYVYRMGPDELEELRRQIDEMIGKGWIKPSESEFGATILFVPKKGGKLRMCIDYCGLNRITRKNAYPLPRIDDLLDVAGGCKVFSKIDLKSGYHQIEVDPTNQHKTAFKTRDGLYEFTVMPFGLTNAPTTFQSLMDKVFRHQINQFVVVYLDDILIFGKSMEEHMRHLEEVMQILKDTQLHLNLEKSEFGRDNVIYLGHRLFAAGLEPEATKVEVIQKWPKPANAHELRSFLGLASYYRKFVPKFSIIARPLSRLASKNVSYAWNEECTITFEALKVVLRIKPSRQKPYGLLHPLPIPDGPGESVSIHFTDMGKKSRNGYSQVMVIIDRFSKFLNLIPLPPHAPTDLVIDEFNKRYVLHYDPPKTLVSDRDTRFISADWKDFTSQTYDMKLKMTSGRHPEANGLVEEINQTVIQLLRALIVPDQNSWDEELPIVQGLYNNSIHSSTGMTPNRLHLGWKIRNPVSYLFPDQPHGLTAGQPGYTAKFDRLLKVVVAAMDRRRSAMIKHANKKRQPAPFTVGSYVWVKMSEFSEEEGVSRKLLPQYYGPWQVLNQVGSDSFGPSYTIDVPAHLRTYPVFHASKLFPYEPPETLKYRESMIPGAINGGYEVDRIVKHSGKGRNRQYKVHFLYHPLDDFYWIARKDLLQSALRVVNAYKRLINAEQQPNFTATLTPTEHARSLFAIYTYDALCKDSD
ncbi:hypothetical protein CBR_g36976 [Chara braunii]|uniref:Reverse transcriptase n=1 Tax=Chara braunii TaxID=69332 RepID=A0A388JZI7_CHABU|nr:hypothetical protein CBR_g36976 [Chara braunii]|eukprot:GBG63208.1 hypothetical protein CBR_g36976 [Chara braunii]